MDGVLAIGGCDKNMLGVMIVMVCFNIFFIFVYGGIIKFGYYVGEDLIVVSVFEVVGQYSVGKIDEEIFYGIEWNVCFGVGFCGGMFIVNIMFFVFEVMGMSLFYFFIMAVVDGEKVDSIEEFVKVLVEVIKKQILFS